ncbi:MULTISPECIES: DsbA family protein [unclassified Sporosarcina]|uniref:DsbA family oxidoreductase n=1 Tax=unclassified Sporosarcina TaxID=2647733 RepID=UPI000C164455|nr:MULTISPECIES: DsbA family oxidoreductase [unclassified Sporosarcina]PIC99698.1 disulfide bond formation protein DsbA [Sporosarcina sp. P29]PID06162.1 disulfide bond formation protein DsbA [Sporosarcina sp. P30]PID09356.1 disulfide bond formation protein DsbA [Sporosarcina sp. P31]PID12655.1 disulfide bond formation protein DsbA [Sporosarcina sp. P32b]
MKIEVWSDYVCPFCYIGKRRLEHALKQLGLEETSEVVFKAYQLDPNTPVASDLSVVEGLAGKYNVSKQQAENMMTNIEEQAKTVDLHYQVDKMKTSNTFDAHRLAKFAKSHDVEKEVTERLLHGYFVEGERIDTEEVLVAIATEVGLDAQKTKEMLYSNDYGDEVKNDIKEAQEIGVQGVPFFVINRKYAISGAQPTEAFVEALEKIAKEEGMAKPKLQVLGTDEGGLCDDGACDI